MANWMIIAGGWQWHLNYLIVYIIYKEWSVSFIKIQITKRAPKGQSGVYDEPFGISLYSCCKWFSQPQHIPVVKTFRMKQWVCLRMQSLILSHADVMQGSVFSFSSMICKDILSISWVLHAYGCLYVWTCMHGTNLRISTLVRTHTPKQTKTADIMAYVNCTRMSRFLHCCRGKDAASLCYAWLKWRGL